MSKRSECDVVAVLGGLIVFALPLTLLIPDFSPCHVVPKVQVTRFHILSQHATWNQLHTGLVTCLVVFFCLYLEIRKRKLDDLVENVIAVSKAANVVMIEERERQTATVQTCVKLIETSIDHYENLMLFRDELSKKDATKVQHPPAVELSSSEM